MNFYAIPPFIVGILITGIALIVLLKGKASKLNIIFSSFCFSMVVWLFAYTKMYLSSDDAVALAWARVGFVGIIFIPVFAYHFIIEFLKLKRKIVLPLIYILTVPSLIFSQSDHIYGGIRLYRWGHYPTAGEAYFFFLLMFAVLFVRGVVLLFEHLRKATELRKEQIKYVCLAFGLGSLGLVDYLSKYPVLSIYPFGYICALFFISLIAIAIMRYRLLDMRIAVARAGIFIAVYTLVLGIPFGLAGWGKDQLIGFFGQNWFWVPMFIFLVLSTAGPFIYQIFRKKVEETILREQKQYQKALIEISSSFILIKELNKLLEAIVVKILDIVKVSWAAVYLKDDKGERYLLKYKGKGRVEIELPTDIPLSSDLVKRLCSERLPIVGDEIVDFGIKIGIVVPCLVNEGVLGFLLLGSKPDDRGYNQDDVSVFTVLSNQIALALENAGFIEEFQRTQAQLFASEQMASMGTMAGGMTHQINNRFHAIMMATSDTLDSLNFIDLDTASREEIKKYLEEVKYAMTRVQENAKHGGKIANDFLNFSQPERMKREAKEFDLREPIERAIEMTRLKTTFPQDTIERRIPDEPFKMEGNFVLLQDAFFNLIDNAVDALKKKEAAIRNKEIEGPQDYKGKIIISMKKVDSRIELRFEDNGTGVSEENRKKMFVPFFTTKATAAKGTGLGLYVIQKIIHSHHGQITVESEYGKGMAFDIILPVRAG